MAYAEPRLERVPYGQWNDRMVDTARRAGIHSLPVSALPLPENLVDQC